MKKGEIIESFDATPTWSALLLPMLNLVEQGKLNNDLETEFKNMALAADKWNAHVKALKEAQV